MILETISLRTYLERIPLDAMTWGEAEELDRIIAAEVAADLEAERRVCEAIGHVFVEVPVDYFSDDCESRCASCGAMAPDGDVATVGRVCPIDAVVAVRVRVGQGGAP